jgi:hypothetical protein
MRYMRYFAYLPMFLHETPIHNALVSPRTPVRQELVHLGRRRRQPCQIERHPPQQRPPVGRQPLDATRQKPPVP